MFFNALIHLPMFFPPRFSIISHFLNSNVATFTGHERICTAIGIGRSNRRRQDPPDDDCLPSTKGKARWAWEAREHPEGTRGRFVRIPPCEKVSLLPRLWALHSPSLHLSTSIAISEKSLPIGIADTTTCKWDILWAEQTARRLPRGDSRQFSERWQMACVIYSPNKQNCISSSFSSLSSIIYLMKFMNILFPRSIWRSPLTRVVDALMMQVGQLDVEEQYVYLDPKADPHNANAPRKATPFHEALVFVVGGGNYSEYQNLSEHFKVITPFPSASQPFPHSLAIIGGLWLPFQRKAISVFIALLLPHTHRTARARAEHRRERGASSTGRRSCWTDHSSSHSSTSSATKANKKSIEESGKT